MDEEEIVPIIRFNRADRGGAVRRPTVRPNQEDPRQIDRNLVFNYYAHGDSLCTASGLLCGLDFCVVCRINRIIMTTGSPAQAQPIVRPMDEADLAAALRLWEKTDGVEVAEGDSAAELARYLLRNPGASQVATQDGVLIGAVLAGHDGRRGLIYHLAVAPGHRGRFIGRSLVSKSLASLKLQGIRRALILVASDNPGGRNFWERSGWQIMNFAHTLGIDLSERDSSPH